LGRCEGCVARDQKPPDHHAKFNRKVEQVYHRKVETAVKICSSSNIGPNQRLSSSEYVFVFTSFSLSLRTSTTSCRRDDLELVTWMLDPLQTSCDRGLDGSRSYRCFLYDSLQAAGEVDVRSILPTLESDNRSILEVKVANEICAMALCQTRRK
jgi:hypothetical protein